MPGFEFSSRQQRTITAALTILSAAVIVAAIGFLFAVLGSFLARFANVFLPLVVAAVAALVFKPWFDWMHLKLRFPRVLALVGVFLSVLIPVGLFSFFFGNLVVEQIVELAGNVPEWWQQSRQWVTDRAPQIVAFIEEHKLDQALGSAVDGGSAGGLVSGLQSFGRQALSAGADVVAWAGALLGWIVLPVYFSFFLLADTVDAGKLENYLPFLKSETRKDVVYLVQQFLEIIVAFFRGQLIIAFLQGVLFAIGFSVVGLRYGFVIGLVLGFLNIVPYLGNMIGLGTALPLAFFQTGGGLTKVAVVLVVFALVQAIEGYLLTPKIMGDRTGLHPMVIIVAIFFWGSALNGILGMILAIPLTAFLVVFWRLAKERYLTEIV
jgi:predicted PurR-regulated permease PerM